MSQIISKPKTVFSLSTLMYRGTLYIPGCTVRLRLAAGTSSRTNKLPSLACSNLG